MSRKAVLFLTLLLSSVMVSTLLPMCLANGEPEPEPPEPEPFCHRTFLHRLFRIIMHFLMRLCGFTVVVDV